MKSLALILPVAISLVSLHTGCERHPASETIPGYAEKAKADEAQAKEKATQKEATDSNAPGYFPDKKN